ncbi:Kinesin-like protein kip2, variant 2 [Basidiobolus ranarum]|uniref:Kinesin-like protein kip2, variant 2 n=1 Tax=Basidiobolus ranarum TaxID=34480 RepID=A0ABR2WGF7_9FUNG
MVCVDSQPGVIPQAVTDVFNFIHETAGSREFLLRVSYMEIYNETIRDLLSPEVTDLRIHEDKRRGVYVSPLREEIVTSPKQVMRVIHRGEGIYAILISFVLASCRLFALLSQQTHQRYRLQHT